MNEKEKEMKARSIMWESIALLATEILIYIKQQREKEFPYSPTKSRSK